MRENSCLQLLILIFWLTWHFQKRHSEWFISGKFYDQSPPLEVYKAEWIKPWFPWSQSRRLPELALLWAGSWATDLLRPLSAYITLCPKGSQHPGQSDPFCYRSKRPFNKWLVLLLPKMIPKLHLLCSQRLPVLLIRTLAGNIHSWTTFAWLMEQLRLDLRSRSVRLSHAADLYPRPGDSAAVNDTVLQIWDI